jgi:hypothetical protein
MSKHEVKIKRRIGDIFITMSISYTGEYSIKKNKEILQLLHSQEHEDVEEKIPPGGELLGTDDKREVIVQNDNQIKIEKRYGGYDEQ